MHDKLNPNAALFVCPLCNLIERDPETDEIVAVTLAIEQRSESWFEFDNTLELAYFLSGKGHIECQMTIEDDDDRCADNDRSEAIWINWQGFDDPEPVKVTFKE